MELERHYLLDEDNKRVAVQLDIATFEKLIGVLKDDELAKLIVKKRMTTKC